MIRSSLDRQLRAMSRHGRSSSHASFASSCWKTTSAGRPRRSRREQSAAAAMLSCANKVTTSTARSGVRLQTRTRRNDGLAARWARVSHFDISTRRPQATYAARIRQGAWRRSPKPENTAIRRSEERLRVNSSGLGDGTERSRVNNPFTIPR
jgi:hypothetical protein